MKHFLFLLLAIASLKEAEAFGISFSSTSSTFRALGQQSKPRFLRSTKSNNILILDHLNINHEKGRHDLLKAFYFDFLKCAVDPRKKENLEKGKKTLWANIGSQQFHLPEGSPSPQVLQGVITLVYPDINSLIESYDSNPECQRILSDSKFEYSFSEDGKSMDCIDPWGSKFHIVQCDDMKQSIYVDSRGKQPGPISEGIGMIDLTLYVPSSVTNFEGIARFYNRVLGVPLESITINNNENKCVINIGPHSQTLTFCHSPDMSNSIAHEELVVGEESIENARLSNYGAHISIYVANLPQSYDRASELGLIYVNPRFKRRAFTKDEAIDQCMFRLLDIVDPEYTASGPILRIEHEVRSVVKKDGVSKYKSCPFDEVPTECLQL